MIFVFYTKGCSPHVREFRSLSQAKRFCTQFKRSDDDWIDFLIKGEIVQEFEGAASITLIRKLK